MKNKFLLVISMVALLACIFAISASAEKYVPAFGEKTEVEGMAEKATFGDDGKFDTCTSRVLMNDGITYPAYYIYNDSATQEINFSALNDATGKTYDRNTVICLEIPEGVTTLPNCYGANGSAIFWGDRYTPTIEYLKFPSTLTSMSADATIFSMKSLVCLDMSLSKIEAIPPRGVQSASALTEIYFPNTLKTIGDNAFSGCSSLTHVDFTDTQLQDIGFRGFFECYKLEEVKLGVHIKKMQTQCFYRAGINSDKSFVKYYIHSSFEEIYNQYGEIMQEAKMAVIYYTGTNADTGFTVLHSSALKNGAANWATVDASAGDFDESTAYTANVIIYNYNTCKAFYNGEHLEDNNPCVINCSQCNLSGAAEENPVHKEAITIVYPDGFAKEGIKTLGCINEGCKHGTSESTDALFECQGFSASLTGDGISLGFKVNNEAIAAYTDATGKTLKYGVFAASQSKLGEEDIFGTDGNANANAIVAEIARTDFAAFDIKVMGFTTADHKKASIAMGAYVKASKDGETEYSYMQSGEPANGGKYCFSSYNDIIAELEAKG